MSYTKQTWTTGDTVTATKLNHMEDGIAGAGGFDAEILLSFDGDDWTASAISGTYASIMSILGNNDLPRILIKWWNNGASASSSTTSYFFYGYPGYNNYFEIQTYNLQSNNDWYVRWASDDTLIGGVL